MMSGSQNKQQVEKSQIKTKRGKTEVPQKGRLKLAQMLEAPETLRRDEVIDAQQQLGNQVVQRALDKKEPRESIIDEQGNLETGISDAIQRQRGGGTPLPENIQKEASRHFQHDFEDVRLHTDEKADRLSQKIRARAFTIGKDIFFKSGVFEPATSEGRETLIHELTHVVQQSGSQSSGGRLKLGARDNANEKEADRVGKEMSTPALSGETTPGSAVQAFAEEDELQMQATEEEEEELQMQVDEEELQMQMDEEEELQMQMDEEEEVQTQMDEEEELQMQMDEEEELQMQVDEEEELQMQGEEEELQMQGEEEELQMQGEEEELQMQMDEEEIQMEDEDEDDWETGDTEEEEEFHISREKFQELSDTFAKTMGLRQGDQTESQSETESVSKTEVGTAQISEDFRKKVLQRFDKNQKNREKQDLINKLKDPTTSTEEAAETNEKLKALYKRPLDPRLSVARKGRVERLKNLKEQALKGDKEAYEKYQAEQSKASGYDKFLAGSGSERTAMVLKGIGKGLWGATKGLFGSTAKDLKTHFFGPGKKKEEKKEEKPATPPINVFTGGGGGGGMMEIMEKYADLRQENQDLKKQLEELQKSST
jgi:hypothetical protein